nr:ATP synthase F0 subunit 8 [Mycomya sp. WQY006]
MPQMAPINWLSLFIMFTIVYLLFCILNYYNYFLTYPLKTNKINTSKKKFLNWKW